MDFEIDDGLNKLQESGLLVRNGETLQAIPLEEANLTLQQRWHDIIAPTNTANKEEQNDG